MKTVHPCRRSLSRRAFLSTSAQATVAACFTATSLRGHDSKAHSFVVEAGQVRGLAVNAQGQLAVAADEGILFYGAEGLLERKVAAGRAVRAVCFDSGGRLFVAFKDQTARLSNSGKLEPMGTSFGSRETVLTSIALADNGDIYAADSGARLVWQLDADGNILRQLKPSENGFSVPRGFFPIAWQDGKLLVAEPGRHQIHRYSREGRLLSQWGGRTRDLAGFSGCCNPVSITPLSDGTIVTAERGQPRVKVFDSAGGLRCLLAGPEEFEASTKAALSEAQELSGCQEGILDLAAAPGGKVIVLDRTTRELRTLARS